MAKSKVLNVGIETVEGCYWENYCLRLKIPKETRKIETPMSIWQLGEHTLLECVDKILEDSRMYLADMEYRVRRELLPPKKTDTYIKKNNLI